MRDTRADHVWDALYDAIMSDRRDPELLRPMIAEAWNIYQNDILYFTSLDDYLVQVKKSDPSYLRKVTGELHPHVVWLGIVRE